MAALGPAVFHIPLPTVAGFCYNSTAHKTDTEAVKEKGIAKMENARRLIDESIVPFPQCQQCRHEHHLCDEDDLCEIAMSADGLPVRCVGKWASQKIYYLLQYFQIFTQGMRKKWDGNLRYVEVCSGPGRCCTRDKFEQDGTALAILKHHLFNHLQCALFFDFSEHVVDTLRSRIANLGLAARAHAIHGDYNRPETITNAMRIHGNGCLTLCLIDPTDCSLPFETVKSIYNAADGKCDFIISFFEQNDFNRNGCDAITKPQFIGARMKYSKFVGDLEFAHRPEIRRLAEARKTSELSEAFRETYVANLARIGLTHHDWVTIGKFYRLLYASSHETGMKFWKACSKYDFNHQTQLDLFA